MHWPVVVRCIAPHSRNCWIGASPLPTQHSWCLVLGKQGGDNPLRTAQELEIGHELPSDILRVINGMVAQNYSLYPSFPATLAGTCSGVDNVCGEYVKREIRGAQAMVWIPLAKLYDCLPRRSWGFQWKTQTLHWTPQIHRERLGWAKP